MPPPPPAPSPICQAGPFKTRPAPPLRPGFRRRFPGAAAEDAPAAGGGGGGACARRRGLSQRRGSEPRPCPGHLAGRKKRKRREEEEEAALGLGPAMPGPAGERGPAAAAPRGL